MPPSCALLNGFAIGARVALLWHHNANRSYNLAFVSDIAVFVLKADVKLQQTNQPTNKLASSSRYDNIVRTRNVSECSVLAVCLVSLAMTSLHCVDTAGCETGRACHLRDLQRFSLSPVYTTQPVVKLVVKPV